MSTKRRMKTADLAGTVMDYQSTPVREVELAFTKREVVMDIAPLINPSHVRTALVDLIDNKPQEQFAVVSLDVRLKPVGVHMVSMGTVSASLVHPREVFRPALYLGASSIIVSHSHPSGEVEPSDEDVNLTERICKAGILVGIPVLDHVIIAGPLYFSFHEQDLMPKLKD